MPVLFTQQLDVNDDGLITPQDALLIAAHSKMKIPVSCVEQGRWGYRSKRFGTSGSHSSSKLRYFLKRSVTQSVMAKRGHRSDQGKVWEEVQRQQSALGASSRTSFATVSSVN